MGRGAKKALTGGPIAKLAVGANITISEIADRKNEDNALFDFRPGAEEYVFSDSKVNPDELFERFSGLLFSSFINPGCSWAKSHLKLF
ncbi:MAG: hypothetical protein ABSH17_08965 [Syntrophobacteraceae bacterium]